MTKGTSRLPPACRGSAKPSPIVLRKFRNYCGLIKIARCGFPWKKTTKRPVIFVYTNCETSELLHWMRGRLS
jgi:hypothetical protein